MFGKSERDRRQAMALEIIRQAGPLVMHDWGKVSLASVTISYLHAWVETGEWPEVKPIDDVKPAAAPKRKSR